MAESPPKRARTMPAELKEKIEKSIPEEGEIEYHTKSHKKRTGPVRPMCLPSEDLRQEKSETVRRGHGHRVHYACTNPKCTEPIRQDKWDTHVMTMISDRHLQEDPALVLERSMNFAPDGEWDTKESRMQRVVTLMEQRHYLALARQHEETDLAKRITEANHFKVRLTNMLRATDPTSEIFLAHYAKHYNKGDTAGLADLIFNVVFVRNTMSKEVVKMCEEGKLPWLRVENGQVTERSKADADAVFLSLGGRVFFGSVEPMRSRSRAPRRGWSEFVSELVSFAKRVHDLSVLWQSGEKVIEQVSMAIRKIPGFGGKGFRMKEIVLDLAEVTRPEYPAIEGELLDFGVVGPGPRRALNFVNNRRWFDNEQDRTPSAEAMYIEELREFRAYLQEHTSIPELRDLNLLGAQFALCEASKYFFYLRYDSGPIYRPSTRDFALTLQEVAEPDAQRLRSIWKYWEDVVEDASGTIEEDALHPDHRVVMES